MKAYEFYVLLGKYKRKSMSRSEYDRFCSAIATVRGYRSTFHESTGESYPVFAQAAIPRSQPTRSGGPAASAGREGEGDRRQSRASLIRTESSPEPSESRPERDVIEQHRVFKRVRRQHRRRFRAVRLLRDFLLHHPFLIFLAVILLIAAALVLSVQLRRESSGPQISPPTPLQSQGPIDSPAETFVTSTVSAGRFQSEADALLNVNPDAFEWTSDPLQPMEVPITGLEQAILEGLESRFPDPGSSLQSTLPSEATIPASGSKPNPSETGS